MRHCYWLPVAALLFCGSTLQAQPAGPGPGADGSAPGQGPYGYGYSPMQPRPMRPTTPRSSAGREAAATISAGLDKLFEFLRSDEQPNKLQTAAFLDREIAPYFDFAYMAQFVAGPNWERMSDEQRRALAAQLESRILGGLTERVVQYSDQKVRYLRPRPGTRGSVDVQVGLLSPGTYPAKLVFRLYAVGDGWKVYDVLAEGRSLLAYYRTAFDQRTAPQRQTQPQVQPQTQPRMRPQMPPQFQPNLR